MLIQDLLKEMYMYCIRFALLILLPLISNSAFSAYATGIIDGVYDGTRVRGWACAKGSTRSIPVHIYARTSKGYKLLAGVLASSYSEAAVDNACQHAGNRGKHRFSYTFTTAQKRDYKGVPIYIFGIADELPHRPLGNSGKFVVPFGKGYLDPGSPGTMKGWACIEKVTRSVYVDIYADSRRIKTVLANRPGSNVTDSKAIAKQCKHEGKAGNHRFSVTFTDREKALYAGQRLSANVRETATWLANSWRDRMSGEVSYVFIDNTFSNSESDKVRLSWDYANTAHCSAIKGTLVSFPGRAGISHDLSESYVKQVEKALGMGEGCVRLIRADVNPGTNNNTGGYWLKNNSYKEASGLMGRILANGSEKWTDYKGQRPIQGKMMVVGSSAGGMISAAALEWNDYYRKHVDRTLFMSAPLGVDLSNECSLMSNKSLKTLLDGMFKLKMPNTCLNCSSSSCGVPSSKNVVDVSDHSLRDYLKESFTPVHEIAILVGSQDGIGCNEGELSNCTVWNAAERAREYINTIKGDAPTNGASELFQEQVIPLGENNRFSISVISGGTHDLWGHPVARQRVCKNALAEVGASDRICDTSF